MESEVNVNINNSNMNGSTNIDEVLKSVLTRKDARWWAQINGN